MTQLKELFRKSKEETDFHALLGVDKSALAAPASPNAKDDDDDDEPMVVETKTTPPPKLKKPAVVTKTAPETPSPAKNFVFKKRVSNVPAAPTSAKVPKFDVDAKPASEPPAVSVSEPVSKPKDKGKSLPNGQAAKNLNSSTISAESAAAPTTICDVFIDVKIYIPDGRSENATLQRYFIAFGGDLLMAHEQEVATHVLVDVVGDDEGGDGLPGSAKRVTSDWIWHSIRKRMLLDVEAYTV